MLSCFGNKQLYTNLKEGSTKIPNAAGPRICDGAANMHGSEAHASSKFQPIVDKRRHTPACAHCERAVGVVAAHTRLQYSFSSRGAS